MSDFQIFSPSGSVFYIHKPRELTGKKIISKIPKKEEVRICLFNHSGFVSPSKTINTSEKTYFFRIKESTEFKNLSQYDNLMFSIRKFINFNNKNDKRLEECYLMSSGNFNAKASSRPRNFYDLVQQLIELGFDKDSSAAALYANNFDVNQAYETLSHSRGGFPVNTEKISHLRLPNFKTDLSIPFNSIKQNKPQNTNSLPIKHHVRPNPFVQPFNSQAYFHIEANEHDFVPPPIAFQRDPQMSSYSEFIAIPRINDKITFQFLSNCKNMLTFNNGTNIVNTIDKFNELIAKIIEIDRLRASCNKNSDEESLTQTAIQLSKLDVEKLQLEKDLIKMLLNNVSIRYPANLLNEVKQFLNHIQSQQEIENSSSILMAKIMSCIVNDIGY